MSKKHIWMIVALIGLYVAAQLVADVAATRMVELGKFVLPAGTFIFAITFTARDLIHKRLGKTWAIASIWIAAAANVLLSFYLMWVSNLPAPPFATQTEAWTEIFYLVPSITFGSILAELVSELVDTAVFSWWKRMVGGKHDWSWVLVSNAAGLPVDSVVFGLAAFVVLPRIFGTDPLPVMTALSLAFGQIMFKAIVAVVSMPMIYMVKPRDESAVLKDGAFSVSSK